jgi:hypothetical protein
VQVVCDGSAAAVVTWLPFAAVFEEEDDEIVEGRIPVLLILVVLNTENGIFSLGGAVEEEEASRGAPLLCHCEYISIVAANGRWDGPWTVEDHSYQNCPGLDVMMKMKM